MTRRRLLASLSALALFAAACSSSTNTGSATSPLPDRVTTTQGNSSTPGRPVTIAVLCSCSGPFGQFLSAADDVAHAWASSANATGGIDGHVVKLINYDDGGDAGKAVTQAKSAISAHVDVILDLSPLDAAWEQSVDAAKIPVVGGELAAQPYATDPNFYPSGMTPDSSSYALAATARAAKGTKLGAVYCVEAPSCAEYVAPLASLGARLGVPSVYKASISATAPNYTAQCLAAKDAGADALVIADSPGTIPRVAADCAQQGYDPAYIIIGTGFAMSMAKTPGVSQSLWAAYPTQPFFSDAPAVAKMRTAVEKYYPGLQNKDATWSQLAVQGWTAGLLIQAAAKHAGSGVLSAQTIKAGLDSLEGETLDGWSPPLTFTRDTPHRVNCWFTGRVEGGTPKVTNGGRVTCEK